MLSSGARMILNTALSTGNNLTKLSRDVRVNIAFGFYSQSCIGLSCVRGTRPVRFRTGHRFAISRMMAVTMLAALMMARRISVGVTIPSQGVVRLSAKSVHLVPSTVASANLAITPVDVRIAIIVRGRPHSAHRAKCAEVWTPPDSMSGIGSISLGSGAVKSIYWRPDEFLRRVFWSRYPVAQNSCRQRAPLRASNATIATIAQRLFMIVR